MNFTSRFSELSSCLKECSYSAYGKPVDEGQALNMSQHLIHTTHSRRGIVYVIGNGGSAGIASHFSNDLMKALKIASQTFYDSNLMTCLANDLGYEEVFSYPLERVLKPEDLLVAISSSGKSKNILNAAQIACVRKVPMITLSGFSSDNPLRAMGLLNFWINRVDYGLVETAHFFILHTIIDAWNKTSQPLTEYATFS